MRQRNGLVLTSGGLKPNALSGQGGVYNLSTAGNRFFDVPGISASVSPASVSDPARGSATFNARVTLDGDQVHDTSKKQLQW